jgi:hypothetical protein
MEYAYAKGIVIILQQKIKDFTKMRVLHLPLSFDNYGFLKNKIRSQQKKHVQYGKVGNSRETSC